MKNLRRWKTNEFNTQIATLAADARISKTDFTNDHVWQSVLGQHEDPAIAFQTRYGGRVNVASIVPLLHIDNTTIYKAKDYFILPQVVQFAHNYIELTSEPIIDLILNIKAMVFASNAIGFTFTLVNNTPKTLTVRFEAFINVVLKNFSLQLQQVSSKSGRGFTVNDVISLAPLFFLEGASKLALTGTRLGNDYTISSKKKVTIRCVHTGTETLEESTWTAEQWLKQDWTKLASNLDIAYNSLPILQTNDELDHEFTEQVSNIKHGFISGTDMFYPFYTHKRLPDSETYSSVTKIEPLISPTEVYEMAESAELLATLQPETPHAWLDNFISKQQKDGFIPMQWYLLKDQALLCPPILATTAYCIDALKQYPPSKSRYEKLIPFLKLWLTDTPHWIQERQEGYLTTNGTDPLWRQGIKLVYVNAPSLFIYLLSEIAVLLPYADKKDKAFFKNQQKNLEGLLKNQWDGEKYIYTDSATAKVGEKIILIDDGAGDAEHRINVGLPYAMRVVISVSGGVSHTPDVSVTIEGLGLKGETLRETLNKSQFSWGGNVGVTTTNQVYSQVDRISANGLSRVYRLNASTMSLEYMSLQVPHRLDDPISMAQALIQQVNRVGSPLLSATRTYMSNGVIIPNENSVLLLPTEKVKSFTFRQYGTIVKYTARSIKIKFSNGESHDIAHPETPTWITATEKITQVLPSPLTIANFVSPTRRVKIDVEKE
jgi:hypothetical protein